MQLVLIHIRAFVLRRWLDILPREEKKKERKKETKRKEKKGKKNWQEIELKYSSIISSIQRNEIALAHWYSIIHPLNDIPSKTNQQTPGDCQRASA
jgi:hypothetical protein